MAAIMNGQATAASAPPPPVQPTQMPGTPYAPANMGGSPWLSGMPGAPAFTPVYSSSMSMLPGYENYLNNNSQGYDAFKALAMRPGASNWANLATTQQAMTAQDQMNKAAAETGASTAAATNQLSMQGGLTSGARERAAESGQNQLASADQGIARQQGENNLQISMNDAQNQMSELGQLPGMEQSRAGAWEGVRQGDLANTMAENQSLNSFNQNAYGQQMQAWAAGKQAQATSESGKGGK